MNYLIKFIVFKIYMIIHKLFWLSFILTLEKFTYSLYYINIKFSLVSLSKKIKNPIKGQASCLSLHLWEITFTTWRCFWDSLSWLWPLMPLPSPPSWRVYSPPSWLVSSVTEQNAPLDVAQSTTGSAAPTTCTALLPLLTAQLLLPSLWSRWPPRSSVTEPCAPLDVAQSTTGSAAPTTCTALPPLLTAQLLMPRRSCWRSLTRICCKVSLKGMR